MTIVPWERNDRKWRGLQPHTHAPMLSAVVTHLCKNVFGNCKFTGSSRTKEPARPDSTERASDSEALALECVDITDMYGSYERNSYIAIAELVF
jgi:hypothetical protein